MSATPQQAAQHHAAVAAQLALEGARNALQGLLALQAPAPQIERRTALLNSLLALNGASGAAFDALRAFNQLDFDAPPVDLVARLDSTVAQLALQQAQQALRALEQAALAAKASAQLQQTADTLEAQLQTQQGQGGADAS